MADVLEPLILDFLEWIAARPRAYREVMDAWRTSRPRFTVWEDALDLGYVVRRILDGEEQVGLSDAGAVHLRASGRAMPQPSPRHETRSASTPRHSLS